MATNARPPDDRLEHLLATAARVFAERGYHRTTMRELSRETGMSLAGMYHYVKGKDELLYLIQERCFSRVLAGARAVLADAQAESATERLRRFIDHHIQFFARHMSEMKVLSHESESLSAERISGVNALKRSYVEILMALMRESLPEGGVDLDPHVAAYALFGMMNWIYNWYDPNGPVAPEELSRQFARLFLHGLPTPTHTSVSHGG